MVAPMAYEKEIVLVTRFCIIAVYFYMFVFFRKNYLKSKAAGFTNKFFVGYAFFFLALFALQVGMSFYELADYVAPGSGAWVRESFPGEVEGRAAVLFLYNLVQPLYILGVSGMVLLIAAQVYPLELTLNWNKTIITKYLIIVSASMLLVFIPALTWTLFTFIICFAAVLGVVLGLVMNMGVNIKLAAVSTGELRKRSIAIIFASLLFYFGFIWTLEIQEISLGELFSIASYQTEWDIVFGYVLQVISAILYRQGLRMRA
jgi:hypothetical protein